MAKISLIGAGNIGGTLAHLAALKVGAAPLACSSGFQIEVACSSQAVNRASTKKKVRIYVGHIIAFCIKCLLLSFINKFISLF